MTKFKYSDYLSQFRNAGNNAAPRLRGDRKSGDYQSDGASSELDDHVVSAIRQGDVETLKDLASSSSHSVLEEYKDGWMPLHHAAYCGQMECLKILLRAHPGSVDKRTLQEQTALLLAVSCAHLACVQCLLDAGADPDISNINKETPLYKACELENADMVSLLLFYGAYVNQRCTQGKTALHEAVSRNNTEICEILLRAGATINPSNTYSIAPLVVAAQQGHMRALHYLLEKGADVNSQTCDGFTALHEASKNGHKEVVALLLTRNADANKPSHSGLLPLHIAAEYGYEEIVSLLVSVTSRTKLRNSWITPLHLAAKYDRHTVAALLLKTGADVNARLPYSHSITLDEQRTTALYYAISYRSTKTVEVLLNAGASQNLDPVSPLVIAVCRGCVSTVSLLLERGGDVTASIPFYPTTFPTLVAFSLNKMHVLKCLLDNGCDALSCFTCSYGNAPHQASAGSNVRAAGSNGYALQNGRMVPRDCSEPRDRTAQFCEWISAHSLNKWAGPIIDLMLEYVGNVQLCSMLTEMLDSCKEWHIIKQKLVSPRPLQHLCRLKIRSQMGRHRLRYMASLPLPKRMIRYLSQADFKTNLKMYNPKR